MLDGFEFASDVLPGDTVSQTVGVVPGKLYRVQYSLYINRDADRFTPSVNDQVLRDAAGNSLKVSYTGSRNDTYLFAYIVNAYFTACTVNATLSFLGANQVSATSFRAVSVRAMWVSKTSPPYNEMLLLKQGSCT